MTGTAKTEATEFTEIYTGEDTLSLHDALPILLKILSFLFIFIINRLRMAYLDGRQVLPFSWCVS